jgi:hypothetical protein
MFPLMTELDFYTPEDDILHSPRRENVKSYNSVEVHLWNSIRYYIGPVYYRVISLHPENHKNYFSVSLLLHTRILAQAFSQHGFPISPLGALLI